MEGGGVELVGERLVTLVLSNSSMTRRGLGEQLWQMRWQYTYAFLRVWRWWAERGIPGSDRLVAMAERRLALCSMMVGGLRERLAQSAASSKAIHAYLEFRRLDYQLNRTTLEEHRVSIAGSARRDLPQHSVT